MFRTGLASAALTVTLALPVTAQQALTDAERDAFRAEVRAYLMENPEVIMEAVGILQAREEADQLAADEQMVADQTDALVNDGFSWVGGNPDGDITVVEFMDYRCGYCKKAFPEVESLLETDGNIRFIVKEFPILGDASVLGSQFAIATHILAGDAAYKSVHDTLMSYNGEITAETLTRLGDSLGLDSAAILAKTDDPEVVRRINANRALGTALQISGTPTFVVQNKMVRGYVPADQLQQLVDQLRG